jgi:hypothetical protein
MLNRWFGLSAFTLIAASSLSAHAQARVQTFPLLDTVGLVAPSAKIESVNYMGRKCVRVTVDKEDGNGLVLLPDTDFQDGTIEAEIALKSLAPPGRRFPGFGGIAFRVRPDASHYEVFYLRPGNSQALDQSMRNHSAQYASEPDFDWYPLRRQWPWVYESHADLAMETWTKIRIEVSGRAAKLYLNGSDKPTLIADGLKGEDLHGAIALWSYSGEEAYFSNVRITPEAPLKLKNESDATGKWQMHYNSDAGSYDATMELHRDGSKLNGTWSGPLGENCSVTGTWRNGYIELTFPAEWPKEIGVGTPGPVQAFLAGWVDSDSAKGRMRVEGRSDGIWTAKRTE